MKFKVGEQVRVRSDLVVDECYDGLFWYSHMEAKLSGKIFTISAITGLEGRLILSETPFILSEEMLEPVEESIIKALLIRYINLRLKKLDKLFDITDSELCLAQRWELQQLKRALVTNTLELEVLELEVLELEVQELEGEE